jgi:phosphoglycolate phosphatase-like HAD superfamily hydrolase
MLADFDAVIFDYDDTLVNTFEVKWDQHKFVAKKFYGLDITDDDLRKVWGMPFEDMLFELYQQKDSKENMSKNYLSLHDQYPKTAHDGSLKLIQSLLKQGKVVGVLTAGHGGHVAAELETLGFPVGEMISVQGAEHTPVHKPDPAVFSPILELLAAKGITNLESVYIGDAIRDYKAAKDAGMDFIGVTNGFTSITEFQSVGAKYVNSLTELIDSNE